MHLEEIINRIDQRLESLGITALEAESRAGRRDAILEYAAGSHPRKRRSDDAND